MIFVFPILTPKSHPLDINSSVFIVPYDLSCHPHTHMSFTMALPFVLQCPLNKTAHPFHQALQLARMVCKSWEAHPGSNLPELVRSICCLGY